MKKLEFINQLRQNLSSLPKAEVDDIVRDQEEYISDAVASGRAEEDVIARIGDPKSLAQSLVAQSRVQAAQNTTNLIPKARNTWAAVVAFIALAPINFILLFPVLGIWAAMVGMAFAIFGGFIGTGAALIHYVLPTFASSANYATSFARLFFILGSFAMLAFAAGVLFFVARAFLTAILAYIKSNLNLFKTLGDGNVQS